jgi:hypothetical protein
LVKAGKGKAAEKQLVKSQLSKYRPPSISSKTDSLPDTGRPRGKRQWARAYQTRTVLMICGIAMETSMYFHILVFLQYFSQTWIS